MTAIGTHNINWGDTLTSIAQRYGTTVDALMQANPNITNPDLIYAGATLSIQAGVSAPGGVAVGGGQAGQVTGSGPIAAGSGNGADAAAIAESLIGRNAGELKHSNDIPMESWVPNNVNCANFVSGVLQQAGMIEPSQASASVDNLASNLKGAGWQTVSLADARPGDVVLMQKNGQSHVVLFHGFENGVPKFIGSNNVNADGSQRISWGGASGNYEIITPPR
ncbi:LysM peptidoglycan-binding domain-containing protein [Novilysobacter defluvii]|uniref:Peptidoglycan-binding protein n=1 Tax=Lysobacter defluvii IMMIB APB-9 = DSM 18482 TaxID=1385515 RepID=A0A0A0M4X7_9GAMM|nr:LysM domain-containing protein [Lysobacter defluvii]KGO98048.1 peptidoglycan-binding protein [Lysobacter defluvii IMMIB APB-9 = DSM 18482]